LNLAPQYGDSATIALGMWVKLARAFSTLNRLSTEDIRSYGITQSQFAVIEALGHLGPMSLGTLARKMLVSCGNTTVIIGNLEREGLVDRVSPPEDKRVAYAYLTPKGQNLFREIFPKHAAAMTGFASVLSESEQEMLGALLKKLGRGLEKRDHTRSHTSTSSLPQSEIQTLTME
jgi:MarR family transcriptional regulator, 2-MHQ and catechol-resistance regulon repressor